MLVGLFDFRNLVHMLERDRPRDAVTRPPGALFDPSRLLEEMRRRRRFRRKRERAVGLDRDERRYGQAWLDMCGPGVEFLAEIHRLNPLGSQGWANRRRWSRLSGRNKQSLETHNKKRQSGHTVLLMNPPTTIAAFPICFAIRAENQVHKASKTFSIWTTRSISPFFHPSRAA